MVRIELRNVATETVYGTVEVDEDGRARFEGSCATMWLRLRDQVGDDEAAAQLFDGGWSNGYVYLVDPATGRPPRT